MGVLGTKPVRLLGSRTRTKAWSFRVGDVIDERQKYERKLSIDEMATLLQNSDFRVDAKSTHQVLVLLYAVLAMVN